MKFLILSLLFSSLTFAQDKYYGAKSTEAILRFEGKIKLSEGLSAREKKAEIDEQVQHLIGHFQAPTFLSTFRFPGVLGENYKVSLSGDRALTDGSREVSYRFEGKVNFHRNVFRNADKAVVPLNLPYDLSTIYQLGVVRGKNRCTDEHYNSDGDFFYFWDPDKEGCPLQGNTTDVLRLKGQLFKLANTTSTYPEYDRLYAKEKLKIAVFIGYIDNPTNRDFGAYTYRGLRERLKAEGFDLLEEQNLFRLSGNRTLSGVNHRAVLEKTIRNGFGQKMQVEVSLLLSETDYGLSDKTFHRYLVEAFETADIVTYDGHSGLGGNLDLNSLPTINFTSDYQIYFFNGCSSYPYFNGNYFAAKPGNTMNLEIVTSGLPTLTSTSEDNMWTFLTPFISGHLTSWQNIMNRLEASNGEEESYLMGVNGDEDNQFRPR